MPCPTKVKSLAKRIKKKQPGASDEYAMRVAYDVYHSYVAKKKKTQYSGLKTTGGKRKLPLAKQGEIKLTSIKS